MKVTSIQNIIPRQKSQNKKLSYDPIRQTFNTTTEPLDVCTEVKSQKIVKFLRKLSRNIDKLILWFDCDREGESLAFEVVNIAK